MIRGESNRRTRSRTVSQLHLWRGGFFVGGTFESIGEDQYNYLAYWNGTEFLQVGGGLSDLPEDVMVKGSSIWVSGSFTAVGNPRLPSYGVARFDLESAQ